MTQTTAPPRAEAFTARHAWPRRTKFWQFHIRANTTWWRAEDHALVEAPFLQFEGAIANMPDVDFRLAGAGKAEITVEGVDYYTQVNSCAPRIPPHPPLRSRVAL